VHLAVLGSGPPAYALAAVVDDEVDKFTPLAAGDIQPTSGTVHVGVAWIGCNGSRMTGFRNKNFQIPNPQMGARRLHIQSAVDSNPLAFPGTDLDRRTVTPSKSDDVAHAADLWRSLVATPVNPEDVPRLDLVPAVQGRANVPGCGLCAQSIGRTIGRDVPVCCKGWRVVRLPSENDETDNEQTNAARFERNRHGTTMLCLAKGRSSAECRWRAAHGPSPLSA
jgi:hypothetical protein